MPPAHAMEFDLNSGKMNIWRYWSLPEYKDDQKLTIEELTDELKKLLTNSIRRQLIADVPVGILLSGGLDSSIICAIAATLSSKPLKTFTVSLPGHGRFDEGPYAKLVADYFGMEHTELIAESTSVSILPKLAIYYDEPIADHSTVPTSIVSNLVSKSVKVALTGDGGDELFAGYLHYNWLLKTNKYLNKIPNITKLFFSEFATNFLPVGSKGRNYFIALRWKEKGSIVAINQYFDYKTRGQIFSKQCVEALSDIKQPEMWKASFYDRELGLLRNIANVDFQTTLVDGYLVKSDRASMMNALELRAPFLEHSLVEFAFQKVPDSLKANESDRKILLKKLAREILPPEFDINRKQGLSLPLASWFEDGWGNFMKDILMEADENLFNHKFIMRLFKLQEKGYSNADRLFALTFFELWRREYRVTL